MSGQKCLDQALAAPEKDVSDLYVWNARLADSDRLAVKFMGDKGIVRDVDTSQLYILDDCSLRIEGKMTNTPMP